MTSRQRVEAVGALKETDRIPIHHIGLCSEVASKLLGREAYVGGGIQQWREACALLKGAAAHQEYLERSYRDALDIAELTGQDVVRPSFWRMPQMPTRRVDENTILYGSGPEDGWFQLRYDAASEQCVVQPCRERPQSFDSIAHDLRRQEKALESFRPDEAGIAAEIRAQREIGDDKVIRAAGAEVGTPVDGIWFEAMAARPDLVKRYLDVQVARAERQVPFLAGHGLTWLFGGGDMASNEGPMYSPRHFRELVLPRVCRLAEICHRHRCCFFFASDGNLWPVADALFGESGVDGYYEIDRRAGMDLRRLRERFPRLILLGNISSHTVHRERRDEVIQETRACLDEARQCRGVIAGLSNYFVPGTPIANVEAVLDTIRENR
jgi:hypothetical protein